jgi:hypothetical protein
MFICIEELFNQLETTGKKNGNNETAKQTMAHKSQKEEKYSKTIKEMALSSFSLD